MLSRGHKQEYVVRTSVVGGVEPITTHKTNRIRQNGPRHRVPTTNTRAGSQGHAVLRLQARVQLKVVNVPVQLARSLSDLLVGTPLLEVVELLEAKELTELVHGAGTPRARLLHGHDFDDAQDLGCAARAVRASHALGSILKYTCDVVVLELAIWATVDAASLGVSDIP